MVKTVVKRNTITTNTMKPTPPVVKTSDEKPNPNTDDDTLLSPRTNRNLLAEALESISTVAKTRFELYSFRRRAYALGTASLPRQRRGAEEQPSLACLKASFQTRFARLSAPPQSGGAGVQIAIDGKNKSTNHLGWCFVFGGDGEI